MEPPASAEIEFVVDPFCNELSLREASTQGNGASYSKRPRRLGLFVGSHNMPAFLAYLRLETCNHEVWVLNNTRWYEFTGNLVKLFRERMGGTEIKRA